MVRIALTREQAIQYKLPTAFDPSDKGYSATQIASFIKESGGRECIELDALDESTLLHLLETELWKHTGEKEDHIEYNYAVEYAEAEKNNIDLEDVGVAEYQEEYDAVREEHNQIVAEVQALSEKYPGQDNLSQRPQEIY